MAVNVANVYTYRMPSGIPGAVNREIEHTGEANVIDTTNPPLAFGDPVKMVGGKIQALAGGDVSAAIYGFLERGYPGQTGTTYGYGSTAQGLAAAGVPLPGSRCTIMKRGYMTVAMQGTTVPAKGGVIYVRVAGTLPTGGRLNGLEAAVDGTAANTPLVPGNSYFMGVADAGGNNEIAFNI